MTERHLSTTVYRPMITASMDAYMRPWRGESGVAAYWRAVACYDEDLARPVAERLDRLAVPTLALWDTEDQWEPVLKADERVEARAVRILDALRTDGPFIRTHDCTQLL